jgi:hypothetical protein
MYSRFKHFKKKSRDAHNPLQDALANARAMLKIKQLYGLKINW